MGGFSAKVLFIDLDSGTFDEEFIGEQTLRDFLGGYGLGARLLFDRIPKGADPLGPDNMLGILTGVLTGNDLPYVSRYIVVGKSPLTGCWGDANGSGFFGPQLKRSGFDGVFFRGISRKPVYLLLEKGKYELYDARDLWGMDTYRTEDIIKEKYGAKAEVACIGPAGEKQSLIASVVTAKGRVAARSGLGALMGSKRLKGVVVLGGSRLRVDDQEKVKALRRKYIGQFRDGMGASDFYSTTGTPGYIKTGFENGDAPVKNWYGSLPEMGDISEYSYENISRYITRRKSCYRCPVADWGNVRLDRGPYRLEEESHIPEYESASALGSYCLNTNFESVIKCNDICNRYGMDTISAGAIAAFAIQCYEEGILDKSDTDGIELTWGNHASIVKLVEKIAGRDGFGGVLADGVKAASQRIGRGCGKYAIHVGGQELPAHDSRFEPSMASIYRNNATPGRHTQDVQYVVPPGLAEYLADVDFSFSNGKKRDSMRGRARAQKALSCMNHCLNASGMCLFGFLSSDIDFMPECISAVTGWDVDLDELLVTGERIANMRLAFTLRQGINPFKLAYPDIALGKPPLAAGPLKGVSVDIDILTEEFCREMDWDVETGRPSGERLNTLGLGYLAGRI